MEEKDNVSSADKTDKDLQQKIGDIWIDKTAENHYAISVDKEAIAKAIEEGLDKGLEDAIEHFKKQTKLFAFALLGILAMLAVIALVLAGFHNVPLR